jgi:formylglycine-generating enzyme required for sulfatase activity
MHGNVTEWVQDCSFGSYSGAPREASQARETPGCHRRIRGGSFNQGAASQRSAGFAAAPAESRYADLGFRVMRTAE